MQKENGRGVTSHVVILCGGAGSRLWPLSRPGLTKPFLKLPYDRTLIAQTFDRARKLVPVDRIWVVTTRALARSTKKALPRLPTKNLIVEPQGKNTAAACLLAAHTVERRAKGPANLLILPADHYIEDDAAFSRSVQRGLARAAEGESLVTFGLAIGSPKTEFGYIESSGTPGAFGQKKVARFIEKPPLARAKAYQRSRRHFWNSGMFAWRTDRFIHEMRAHAPRILVEIKSKKALEASYQRLPDLSIDYALMEKSKRVEVIPSDFPWSDLGTWAALWEALAKTPIDDVALAASTARLESRGNLIHAKGFDVALFGVDDLVVVVDQHRLLITTREKSASLKTLVSKLSSI